MALAVHRVMLTNALLACLDALLPKRCAACDSPVLSGPLCEACAGSLIPGDEGACPQCGALDLERDGRAPDGHCGPCIQRPPAFSRARGAYAYGGAMADAIRRWKTRPEPTLTPTMCELILHGRWERGDQERPTLLVMVPPDPKRLRQRGFHPAGLLARAMGEHLSLPLDPRAVRTARGYPSSRGQGRDARRERLRGAFKVCRDRVQGARLLLIDDVMTTGATVETISRLCLRAGASSVEVAVLARAPR